MGEHLPLSFHPTLVRAAPPTIIPPPFLVNVEQPPPGRRVEVESQGEGRCHQLTQRPSWLKPGVNRTWVGCAESIQHSKECSLIVCNTGSSQPAWQTNGQNTSIRTAEVEPNVKTGRCPRAYGLPGQTDEETKAQRGLWQRPARNFPFQNLQWLRRQFG